MINEPLEDFNYRADLRVVNSARAFIKSLCEVYGSEKGMHFWDYLRAGLGEEIASDIFLGMLIHINDITVQKIGSFKIEAIKEIRSFTGMGLKEAKDFVESVIEHGPQIIKTSDIDHQKINQFCDAMTKIGCIIY